MSSIKREEPVMESWGIPYLKGHSAKVSNAELQEAIYCLTRNSNKNQVSLEVHYTNPCQNPCKCWSLRIKIQVTVKTLVILLGTTVRRSTVEQEDLRS